MLIKIARQPKCPLDSLSRNEILENEIVGKAGLTFIQKGAEIISFIELERGGRVLYIVRGVVY